VMVSKMKEWGIRHAVQDSSGNAGAAVAAYCTHTGIACDIYVPQATSPEKLRQIRSYGANLILVPGDRDATARAALKAAETGYYASHCWNPFFHHGVKTFSYEVCEQLGWRAPDCVVLPAGNGSLLIGVAIGFAELRSMNIIEKSPRLIAVQAQACAPLFRAFQQTAEDAMGAQPTIAEGIAIAQPIRLRDMVSAIEKTNGAVMAVDDAEIVQARDEMGKMGFFIEPTAAVAIAGAKRYLSTGVHDEREMVVTLFTGHGLKSGK
jgi:threonine synthase